MSVRIEATEVIGLIGEARARGFDNTIQALDFVEMRICETAATAAVKLSEWAEKNAVAFEKNAEEIGVRLVTRDGEMADVAF